MRKCRRSLEAARVLREFGSPSGTVDRAYFAMFDAAKAMGLAEGKQYPPCSKWLDTFGEIFAHTGRIEPGFFTHLREAYRLRKIAVYGFREEDRISPAVAAEVLSKASEFVSMAESFIKGAGGESETQ
ncbi:MAG TPA: HEPN domain-containing protein [Terriglobia bacterium]|nr:HEPN domain-containing protein [Terriglobia bacterium]